MKHLITILLLVTLTYALWLNTALAAAPSLKVQPQTFLAKKPLQATLSFEMPPSNQVDVQLLPGGPYQKNEHHYSSTIQAITTLSNEYRYTALAKKGIEVTHLKDQSIAPRQIGDTTVSYQALDVNDAILLAVTESGSVQLFSLDSNDNTPIGSYDTFARIVRAQIDSQQAFLLSETGTLLILDISDPQWPILAGEYYDSPESKRFVVRNGLIWLAAGDQGLIVLDTLNPLQPRVVSRYKTNHPALDIALQGDIALVASGIGGLILLNVANPSHIYWLGSHSNLGYSQRVVANDFSQAVVSNSQNEIYHLDFTVPNQPSILSAFRYDDSITQLLLHSQELSLVSEQRISAWDISAEQPLVSNENLNMGEGVNYGGQRKGVIDNDILYVADWFSGLHIYDISQRQSPRLLSSFHTPGSSKGVAVKEGIAYIADDDHGLQLVDVSDPTNPQAISALLTKGLAYTPVIEGDLLYLASHHGGFQIVDISNAFQPKVVGEYDTPSKAWSIAVKDNIAYVADAESGLLVFNTSNPSEPKLIGRFDPGGNAEDVLVDGNLAYLAFFDQGLYILDISNPAQPHALSHLVTPGNARGLDKQNFVLYLADWLGGMHAINIADPQQPKFIGSYDTQGAAWGLKAQGFYSYIFDWWGGLTVLDVSHPSDISRVGDYNQRTPVAQLRARGNYLFAAQGNRGLQVYDIKNPLNPTWITGKETQGNIVEISLEGEYAFAAAEEGGLTVFDIANPFSPQLINQYPTVEPLQRIKTHAHMAYGQDRLGHIIGFNTSDPKHIQQNFELSLNGQDYQVNEHYLLVLYENRLARYNLDKGIPTSPSTELEFPYPLKLARIQDHIAYVIDERNTLYITDLLSDTPTVLSSRPLEHDVADMLFDGHQLHINDKQHGIFTYRYDEKYQFSLITKYPLLSHISQIYAHQDQLYGSGQNHIVAINKLPSIQLSATVDPTTLTLTIKNGLANGAYDILITEKGKKKRYPNALTTSYFGIPTPSIRSIPTPEISNDATKLN